MRWERFLRLTAVLLFAATVVVGFQVQWAEARGFRGGVHGGFRHQGFNRHNHYFRGLLSLLPALPLLSRVFLRSVSGLLWRLLCLRRLWPVPGVRASGRLLLSLLRSEGNLPFRSRHPSGQRLLTCWPDLLHMLDRAVPTGKRMARRPWMILMASFAIGITLSLWTIRADAVGGFVMSWLAADQGPRSPGDRQQPGEGVLHFEVEPDEVEIYLDDQYLGRAHELRGRPVKGILAGNRLLELRWGADRTFLQVVVPVNGTKTIRLNLAPPGPRSSRAHPHSSSANLPLPFLTHPT
ncbi:MAG: hypothetical protein HW376_520 [candidate division NC10 bacterium]|nr:hypothetical protein [candidate division NC10 bacterium]